MKKEIIESYADNFVRLEGLLYTSLEKKVLVKLKEKKPLTEIEAGLMKGWAEDMEDITWRTYKEKCELVEKYIGDDKEAVKEFYRCDKIVRFQELMENCLTLSRQILKNPSQPELWKWEEEY